MTDLTPANIDITGLVVGDARTGLRVSVTSNSSPADLSGYTAAGRVKTGNSSTTVDLTVTIDSSDLIFDLTSAQTAQFDRINDIQVWITNGGEPITVGAGTIKTIADL